MRVIVNGNHVLLAILLPTPNGVDGGVAEEDPQRHARAQSDRLADPFPLERQVRASRTHLSRDRPPTTARPAASLISTIT